VGVAIVGGLLWWRFHQVLSATVTTVASISQAEVAVSRKWEFIFSQIITWVEDHELRKQLTRLIKQIIEKVK